MIDRRDTDPEQVLFDYAMEPSHDQHTLQRYLQRHPSLAGELIDLSLELRLQRATEGISRPIDEAWVETSWDKLRSQLEEMVDPFSSLSVQQMKTARRNLGVPSAVIHGFRTRTVDVATVPLHFLSSLASELGTSLEALRSFLIPPPRLASGLSYKSDTAPLADPQKISFEQLLTDAGVREEVQAKLLSQER